MSTESDPGVWIKRATTDNCTDYYKYMLVYIEDVLHLCKGRTGRYVEYLTGLLIEGRFWATR